MAKSKASGDWTVTIAVPEDDPAQEAAPSREKGVRKQVGMGRDPFGTKIAPVDGEKLSSSLQARVGEALRMAESLDDLQHKGGWEIDEISFGLTLQGEYQFALLFKAGMTASATLTLKRRKKG